MGTINTNNIPKQEDVQYTHPPFLRFIHEYDVGDVHKKLEMCRNCGKVVETKITKN